MDVVTIKTVNKEYNLGKTKVRALHNISTQIKKGEFVTIAGSSGSGKTTLLNLTGCLDKPSAGEIYVSGKNTDNMSEKQFDKLRLRTIGFIFQSFNLIPVLNVYENIELPLLIHPDISSKERREIVLHFVKETGLEHQLKQKPSELSGGQRQRVAVARALATKPEIVLADEPTANLDSKTGIEIIELMHKINKLENTTFIFSSHDPKIISRANRVLYLEDGHLIREEQL